MAESTTKAYAGGVALYLRWCQRTGRKWQEADIGLFMTWLKYTPAGTDRVIPGPGTRPVRSERRINAVLVAVRGFLSFAVLHQTGVRSRRDLVGKIFFAHYEPRLRDNEHRAQHGRPLRGGPYHAG